MFSDRRTRRTVTTPEGYLQNGAACHRAREYDTCSDVEDVSWLKHWLGGGENFYIGKVSGGETFTISFLQYRLHEEEKKKS